MPGMANMQILLYQEMNAISSRMVTAARTRDWETLDRLARSVAKLRCVLNHRHDALNANELRQKTQLIQRILDNDAEIRRHTEPWMEPLCRLLDADVLRNAPRAS